MHASPFQGTAWSFVGLVLDPSGRKNSERLDRQAFHGGDGVFFEQVAKLAEEDGHHPDLHLAAYRNVSIELWTHAIGGLSENDFILAAKIDQIEIDGDAKPASASE